MPNISNQDNDIVVGFKKEEETIIDHLIHGSKEREVILITGMGGLGKTTLAKRVYENNLDNHFDKRAWCTVSQEYDCKKLLNKIYNEVCGHKTEIDRVAEELRKSLMGIRYLIVLDDIWSEKAWEELNRVFPSCDNGSRIVLTCREESVVSDAKHICLPFFTIDECWELLHVKLFKEMGCPGELENVGRQICNKCGGLPLTVGLIAGLLEKVEKNEQMWHEFLLTLNSHVTFGDGIRSNDAIELSYKYLSHHLKSCLLYFAAFQEDEEIEVCKLIQLWICEGFIDMVEKGRVEDEAVDYLNHLVGSNLIMVQHRNYDGGITGCTVHDLVHDFCLTKAKEENFLDVINMEKKWDPTLNLTPRRICFHRQVGSEIPSDEMVPWNSCIYTVLVFDDTHDYPPYYNGSWIAKKFERLTILDLQGVLVHKSIFSEVNTLIHLRYLALFVERDGDEDDDVSPLSLENLECLITLKLRSITMHFPIFFLNMRSLRHMIVTRDIGYDKSCMKKSRSSSVMIEAIPYSLQDFQTWVSPYALTPMHEHLLRKLSYLRTLRCGFSMYPFPEIDFLHHLENLDLSGVRSWRGYPHLIKLTKFPSSVKKIHLSFITVSVSAISRIAQLPNLESLMLWDCKFEEGLEWNVEEETQFHKLKCLQLIFLDIGIWNISSVAESFPCLEQLVLHGCDCLQVMPCSFEDVLTLKQISVFYCNHNVNSWVKNIEESARDIGNEQLNISVKIFELPGITSEDEPIHDNPDSNFEIESIHDNSNLQVVMPSSFEDVLTLKHISVDNCNHNVDNSWVENIEESARNIGNEQLNIDVIELARIYSEHESNFVKASWNKFKLVLHAGMRKLTACTLK